MLGSLEEQTLQYEIKDFSLGLINSLIDTNIPPGGGDIVQNARFDNVQGIKKRENRAKYNSTTLGSKPVMKVERVYIGNKRYFLVVYDTNLKVGTDSTGAFTNLDTVTPNLRYKVVTYKNFAYIFNGVDANMKTAGTTATSDIMGCTALAAAPTAAKNATGVLAAGTYKYYFTWVYDSYQESSRGGYVAVTTDADDSIDIYGFEATPTNATHLKIYRTQKDGSTYYYHSQHTKAQVEGYIVGAKYNDNTADGSLDTATQAPTDNGIPPVCKYGILHQDRIFIAGNSTNKSRLYYSKIASASSYPDIFPSANYIDIAADDGDEIMGLARDPTGTLCVLKKNTIRKVFTDGDPVNWSVSEPRGYYGCIAPYSVAETPSGIIFLSRWGEEGRQFIVFDGQNAKPLSDKVLAEVNKIRKNKVSECEGIFVEDKYYLTYCNEDNNVTHNDTQLIHDFKRNNFSTDTKNINSFCVWYGRDDQGELYTGDSMEGFCYREDSTSKLFDIVQYLKSELDAGVVDDAATGGTETNPTLALTSGITADVGAQIVSTVASAVSNFAGEDDTVSPSGSLVSPVLPMNAQEVIELFWNESLGTEGDMQFWLRTGTTTAAVSAATWAGPFTDPDGSDLAAVSADTYLQYKIRLYNMQTSAIATPKLYLKNDYLLKIYAGYGTPEETSIPFNFRSGNLDLGYPRQYKRLKSIQIEYDSDSTGNLYCYYSLDGGIESSTFLKSGVEETYIDLSTYPSSYLANFPYNSIGQFLRLRFYSNDANDITIKKVVLIFTLKPPRY